MKKEFTGDFEFNNIEIDIEKKIYKIDGIDIGKGTESISITITPSEVRTTIHHWQNSRMKRMETSEALSVNSTIIITSFR